MIEEMKSKGHTVAFYFFDKQRHENSDPGSAFRAILTQLLHAYQHDHNALDLALLVKAQIGSGQTVASNGEIISLLTGHMTGSHGNIFLFDGVDECSDHESFLTILCEVIECSFSKVLLSSRPTVTVDCFDSHKIDKMHLEEAGNSKDIDRYL